MSIDGTNPTGSRIYAHMEEGTNRPLVTIRTSDDIKGLSLNLTFTAADVRRFAQQLLDAAVISECQSFMEAFFRTRLNMTAEQNTQVRLAFSLALEKAGMTSGGFGSGELRAAEGE